MKIEMASTVTEISFEDMKNEFIVMDEEIKEKVC